MRVGLVSAAVLGLSAGLSGCVSLGVEVPETLLTLTPTTTAPVGATC